MGRPEDVSDYEILEAVKLVAGPATSSEISKRIAIGKDGTNKRLRDLVAQGLLHDKKVGANAKVYWLTDDGKDVVDSPPSDS